ncbi:AAA family ATPase [Burkholderia cenocepacia]|uniref:AAA family ATPase n=1 Tax=Burkholderia cenocepacia TaxID=95486 RepID=UPI001B9374F7|nr:AAA family ATPase [Burkholderia cenocepacia]MBR8137209.1 AAA family ATPase [Burkholderia cenocepacia]
MIVTVGTTKGGSGKSTIALQLSLGLLIMGRRVWLIDGDRQRTSLTATTVRSMSNLPMLAASAYDDGPTLRAQVLQQKGNYDDIVIDAGGRDSSALRAALTVSEKVLIPFCPRSFDVWALQEISDLVRESRSIADLEALAFINKADAQGNENRDAKAAIADFPALQLLDVQIGNRKVYADACGQGRHVEEMPRRNPIACAEIDRLSNMIFNPS